MYSDCECIDEGHGTATPGMCEKHCTTTIPYAVALFFSHFIASMDVVPTMTVFMRYKYIQIIEHKRMIFFSFGFKVQKNLKLVERIT